MTSFAEYAAHGWRLCGIERGKKLPLYANWNTQPIPADAVEGLEGAGLLHALSGTCALDIDHMEQARPWLAARGVNIDALLEADDAVRIDSGRYGRAKLLYRLTRPLRTLKPEKSGLELRCATANGASVQDVLPPSVHPDTKKPYQWMMGLIGDWRKLPTIPAPLFALWRELADPIVLDDLPEPKVRKKVDLNELRKAAFRHSPDCEYPEWIKVASQLHDGTRGAQEGFDIFRDWSKGITRKPYPGDDVLMVHYKSFGNAPGKHVASGEALVGELPAEANDFEIMPPEGNNDTEQELNRVAKQIKQNATTALEDRLIFVLNAERYFDTLRHRIIASEFAIEHMFTSMMPYKNGKRMSPIKTLKESTTKRLVDGLAFHPGNGAIFKDRDGDAYANTYRDRLPVPLEPTPSELEKIEWLFNRIDDVPFREWLVKFFGHVIQYPGVKIKSAPLIWSETQGNGKTTLLKMIPMLLVGARYSREVTCALLNSDFNDYLLNAWHINLTEFRAGTRSDREAISKRIENWIADDEIAFNPKGTAAYSIPNHFFVTATSNKDDAASIDNNDRKWAVHEMRAPQFTEAEQEWIYNDFLLTPRAAAVLRHYFLHVPLDGFVPSAKAPHTEARAAMVASSIAPDAELIQVAFEQRSEPLTCDVVLTSEVAEYIRRHCSMKPSNDRVGRMLAKPPINGKPHQFRIGEAKYRAIIIRNHARWASRPGKEIMAHMSGEDVDITS